jgi:hypothetical protein
MDKKSSKWYIPADIHILLITPVVLVLITILAGDLLPVMMSLKQGSLEKIYFAALGFAVTGILLLFFARLPLYRQRKFWTVGPRALDLIHRRLYWTSYVFLVLGIGLLGVVWLRVQ